MIPLNDFPPAHEDLAGEERWIDAQRAAEREEGCIVSVGGLVTDPKVDELARYFLYQCAITYPGNVESLAETIQSAVDKWMENHSNVTTD